MIPIHRWLEEHGAHHDVVEWARPYAEDWARAWAECPRGDWLLGLAARRGVAGASVVKAACACARLALDYAAEGDGRPLEAILLAERAADGDDDPAARADALVAVEAAIDAAPDPVLASVAAAAFAALLSVDRPEDAPLAASSAVQAAVLDAGDCAMMSAMGYAQSTCADRVREHIAFSPPTA